jgi:hypothetical protein
LVIGIWLLVINLYMPFVSPNEFFGEELREAIAVATTVGVLIASSPEVARLIFILKVASLIITTLLGIGILVLFVKLNIFPSKLKAARTFIFMAAAGEKRQTAHEWEKIKNRMKRGGDAEMRLAVIEADQLLDAMLKKMGVPGSTMSERLKTLRPWQLENLPDVWVAHKIRNRLVHEPSAKISPYEAENVLQIYEKALKSLGLLD